MVVLKGTKERVFKRMSVGFKNGYGESVFPQGSACRIANCLRKALDLKFGLIYLNRFKEQLWGNP